jgi:hypothetical protein
MRDQVIDTVGQVGNILPTWMLSKQSNGRVLGFTPAWVIAYANPGRGAQIAYNIQTQYSTQLNIIDFKVDRYELDSLLTKNWDPATNSWIPTPPTITTFDVYNYIPWTNSYADFVNWINNDLVALLWSNTYPGNQTIFDGNSMQFIDPVDMYSNTQTYDKYLVFPKSDIIQPIPSVNELIWVDDYDELLIWVNDLDQSFIWVTNE